MDATANSPHIPARPLLLTEEPEVIGETKAGRARGIARNMKVRADNRLSEDDTAATKRRVSTDRSQKRRELGTRERDDASRSHLRRQDPRLKNEEAVRSQRRRQAAVGDHAAAARSQKRRAYVTHEPALSARSQKRREGGTHEPSIVTRRKKRRQGGRTCLIQRRGCRRARGRAEMTVFAHRIARRTPRSADRPQRKPAGQKRGIIPRGTAYE